MPGEEWVRAYEELCRFLDTHDKERRFRFKGDLEKRFELLRERLRDEFVKHVVGDDLLEAYSWLAEFRASLRRLERAMGLRGVTFSKEFRSFLEDPLAHLKKKLFNYMYDLLRGRISLEEFAKVGAAAVTTSLRTNMRTLYQSWVFVSLLLNFAEQGAVMIYPEHGFLPLERIGRQRTGEIPPNCVLRLPGRGCLSFFIEAPRPVGWEDTRDLRRVWRLYTALRPDMLVYGGMVLNIARPAEDPPILRPDVIIECKELADWYERSRDLRGPFARPLSAEEWRSRWIEGLWDGLADILGVQRSEAAKIVKEKKSIRVKEHRLVTLYYKLYRPKMMVLVSRAKVPGEVRRQLEDSGITVVDGVGFDASRLAAIAEELAHYARPAERAGRVIELDEDAVSLLSKARELLAVPADDLSLLKASLIVACAHPEELRRALAGRSGRTA